MAQNNSYGMNDALYPLFKKSYENRYEQIGLLQADTLMRSASLLNDTAGIMAAYSIPVYHYFSSDISIEEYERLALHPMQQKAQEMNQPNDYYFCVSNKVAFLNNRGKLIESLTYVRHELKKAQQAHNHNGVFHCQRSVGNVHMVRGEYLIAIDNFRKAISYAQQHLPQLDITYVYQNIGTCYRYMGDITSMLKASEEGVKHSKSIETKYAIEANTCYAYYLMGQDSAFIALHDSLRERKNILYTGSRILPEAIQIARMTLDGASQEEVFDKIGNIRGFSRDKIYLQIHYYRIHGQHEKAEPLFRKLLRMRHEHDVKNIRIDEEYMERQMGNIELKRQQQEMERANTKLQLDNTNLQLHNSNIELENARNMARLTQMQMEQNHAKLDNSRLLHQQMSDSLKSNRQRIETTREMIRKENIRLYIILTIVFIAAFLLCIYLYDNHRTNKWLRDSSRQLEQSNHELDVARDIAQSSEHMKTQFIQNMSHEIRTPLNAIAGFSQVLTEMSDGMETEDKKKMHKMIADNAELLTTLVDDILDMANLQSGKYTLKMKDVTVNNLCRKTIETVRHRKHPDVKLLFFTELPDQYTVNTDAHRMGQVLINMLTNAEKNTTHGSITLKVSTHHHKGMITFIVEDTGTGVPKEKMKTIFERFNKLDNLKQGAGLGLDICRTIAGKLGGEIDIDPEYTGGARFWFTIPVTP